MKRFVLNGKEIPFRALRLTGKLGLLIFFSWVNLSGFGGLAVAGSTQASESGYVGDHACARCHSAIDESYSRTPMAHASGLAAENLVFGEFTHAKSGVHYRVYSDDGAVWLSFERPGDPAASGKRQLLYFLGSGRRGRTYLFAIDDFVFESPVNWYADRHQWDMAPAYGEVRETPLNLPAYPECLRCHASGVGPPVEGTENKYSMPLFSQQGVSCERCHGPGAAHVQGASIVNPGKLSPVLRDAVCMQCHLEGNAGIERPGRHASDYRPGDNLDDYIRHYVIARGEASSLGANSQFEALATSKCKIKSGDSMSCTSCHDPHSSPAEQDRASYYRGRCLACHGAAFGAKHHSRQPDCTSCHMPSSLSADIAHTEVTDHRIRTRPQQSPQLLQDAGTSRPTLNLVPFPYSKEADADLRDKALAWQSLANGGMPEAAPEAERSLRKAVELTPNDPTLLTGLAFVELNRGKIDQARALYEKALTLNPNLEEARANLGVIEARGGHLGRAIQLWEPAFDRAPGKSGIGMNLARVLCEEGKIEDAKSYVLRVLRFNPDLLEARKLSQQLNASRPGCAN